MPTLGEFLVGLCFFGAGLVMVIYARKVVDWFGTSATFERYLGSGGTYTGLRLVGVLFILIGLLLIIGRMDDIIRNFVAIFSKS